MRGPSELTELAVELGAPEHATVRGGRLAFWRAGQGGVPLLLVHGWPSTRRATIRKVRFSPLPPSWRESDAVLRDLQGDEMVIGPSRFEDVQVVAGPPDFDDRPPCRALMLHLKAKPHGSALARHRVGSPGCQAGPVNSAARYRPFG